VPVTCTFNAITPTTLTIPAPSLSISRQFHAVDLHFCLIKKGRGNDAQRHPLKAQKIPISAWAEIGI